MRLSLIAILLIVLIFSCKKEEDKELPLIVISKPSSNTNYQVFDTVWINATVTDNSIIKSVSYGITDSNGDIITNLQSKEFESNTVNFSGYIILDDVRIETGSYSVLVSAFDGKNTEKVFMPIYIKALTKKLEKVFIVTELSNNSNLYELSAQNNFEIKLSINTRFNDAEINSYLNAFYFLDKSGNLKAIDLTNFQTIWQVSNLNNNLVEYKGKLLIFDDYCFASVKQNNIQAFDINGNIRKTAVSELYAYEPSFFTIQNKFFVNFTYNSSISSNYIEKLYFETGASQTYYSIEIDAIALFPLNSNEIIVFGNKQDTMRVAKLKLDATQLQYIDIVFTEKLKAVVQIDNDKFLFSTKSGLYVFEESLNNFHEVRNDISADYLFKEEISEQIYCVSGGTVEVLLPPYYNTLTTFTLPEKIVEVLFNYNK